MRSVLLAAGAVLLVSGCSATLVSGSVDPTAQAAATTLPLVSEVDPIDPPPHVTAPSTMGADDTGDDEAGDDQAGDDETGAEQTGDDANGEDTSGMDLQTAEPVSAVGTANGPETARLQERLLALGFWVQRTDGRYDLTTRQAVMALQKYHGLRASGSVDAETAAAVSEMTERARGRADAGTLIEVDKNRQIMFFVVDGRVDWVLNVSTGTEIPYERPNANDPSIIERGSSVTPAGLFRTNRERPDGWWAGDLGEIYRPKYFVGGVAVHGANSVPNYPASSGCVRVSVPAMDWIWENDLIPLRTPIWVHGEIPGTQ